jgi:predicted DsbA family dithiol-disulfide isomerase
MFSRKKSEKKTIEVIIISDVVCPWCVIGYRRFLKATEAFSADVNFAITWYPFQLNPQMTVQGINRQTYLIEKYGMSELDVNAMKDNWTQLGAEQGFEFNFFDQMKTYNTLDAHQLIAWAAEFDQQTEMSVALFDAYFSQRKDVSDRHVLLTIVEKLGLEVEIASKVLEEGHYISKIRTEQNGIANQGIHTVPAMIFNNRFLISGGQSVEKYKMTIEKLISQ